jgi:hypothetical protein
MATGPDDVRFKGDTGSSRPATKMARLTPIGSRVEASMAAPGELRQLIEVP